MLDAVDQLDGAHSEEHPGYLNAVFPTPEIPRKDPEHPFEEILFVRQGDYISVINRSWQLHRDTELSIEERRRFSFLQLDMPVAGVGWLVHTIEQRFFKSPEEGGIPFGSISYREVVSGEKLHVARSVKPLGYNLTNLDRKDLQFNDGDYQEILFTDGMLFDEGGLDFMRELAKQLGEWTPPGASA